MRKWAKRHLPKSVVAPLKRIRLFLQRICLRMIRALFASMGLNVIKRRDYSSTLPNLDELKENQARWDCPSALSGLRFDLDSMRTDLSRLHRQWGDEFDRETGPFEANRERGFAPGLPRFDARLLYYLMREWKPRHYMEIGSGLSTYHASLAAPPTRKKTGR